MKRIVILSSLIAGVIAGVFIWFALSRPATAPVEKTNKESSSVQRQKKDNPVLTLPGAEAIEYISCNPLLPECTWVVVSKDHPLSDISYRPAKLVIPKVPVRPDKSADEQSLRPETAAAVEAMFTAAKSEGIDLMVASGFRSAELQERYYNNIVATSGQAAADTVSARPGTSEHQTGWALDITTTDRHCYLDTCFGETTAGRWLQNNAVKYGFVLRYPANKTAITKYQYEPWHFRYVGKDLAAALTTSGLTLDEAHSYLISQRN